MDTHFLVCLYCKTIFEVPSRTYYDESIKGRINKLIYKTGIKHSYEFYDMIIRPCCNKPERKWAYGTYGFPEYHGTANRKEYIDYINENNLKLITLKDEYPNLLSNVLIANEL